ncbi:MAG: IS110 family transposase [Phycisphaerae bacterium]|nr:IS110 family transposase [Phycisphaerae bacterium]
MTKVARAKKLSNKSLSVVNGDVVYVGLDVHKKSIHAAVSVNGRLERHWVMPADYAKVVAKLAPLQAGLKRVVYEAGPTGFGLARALAAAGLPIDVIAPSKTPQPADQSAKSDRLDCIALCEYAPTNRLGVVAVPSERQEADRQVQRLRDQVVRKVRRVKQQIKSLLLQYSIAEPEGLANWSRQSVQALRELTLDAELRFCLDELLTELGQWQEQVGRINGRIEQLGRTDRHGAAVAVLTSHPGVGMITAMTFRTELHQAERVSDGHQVAKYFGLNPRVRQSGLTRRDGPIAKTGRGHVRAILIQAAWRWIAQDASAKAVYDRLVRNTGLPQKAIVGMARRLAIRLWRMMTTGEVYRAAE